MQGPALSLVAILLLVPLSGCANPPTLSLGAVGWGKFTAEYEWKGHRANFTLGDPARIMDRDGVLQTAYPLTERYDPSDPRRQHIYWLGADFRLIREDSICSAIASANDYEPEGQCHSETTVEWGRQGALAPLGFGFPAYLSQALAIPYARWTQPMTLSPTIQSLKDGFEVRITDYDMGKYAGWLGLNGNYTFRPGELAPLKAVVDDVDPSHVERLSYTPLGAFAQPADARSKTTGPPPPRPREGTMFPGEAGHDYEYGPTHKEALDELLKRSPVAARAMNDHGCVLRYLVWFNDEINQAANQNPIQPRTMEFDFEIGDASGKAVAVKLHWSKSLVDPGPPIQDNYVVENADPPTNPQRCSDAAKSPWPEKSSQWFFALASRLPISGSRDSFSYRTSPPIYLSQIPPVFGWDFYSMSYQPPAIQQSGGVAGYVPYYASVNANTGWFTSMRVHPDDAAKLDASGVPLN